MTEASVGVMNLRLLWLAIPMRTRWRVVRVALHLAWAVLLVALVQPLISRRWRGRLKQRWSQQLLNILGVHLQGGGQVPRGGELLVANHVSWLDIIALNALAPCAFVAKDDVLQWPVIGWLARHSDTIFLTRGSVRSAQAARREIAAALAGGMIVVVFPEGTTSEGARVLPFHGALLQGALDGGRPLCPVAVRYREPGNSGNSRRSEAAAYCGDTTLLQSIWRIAAAPALCLELTLLPHLLCHPAESRRQVATVLRGMIAVVVEFGWDGSAREKVSPRSTVPPCDSQTFSVPGRGSIEPCSSSSLPG